MEVLLVSLAFKNTTVLTKLNLCIFAQLSNEVETILVHS